MKVLKKIIKNIDLFHFEGKTLLVKHFNRAKERRKQRMRSIKKHENN